MAPTGNEDWDTQDLQEGEASVTRELADRQQARRDNDDQKKPE